MKPRTLKRLSFLFLALLAFWAVLRGREALAPSGTPLWENAARARRLVFKKGGVETVLERQSGEDWRLKAPIDFAADARAVRELLEGLARVHLSEPVSEDPARHAHFKLDDAGALRLTGFLEDGKKPAIEVLIGRQGADFDAFFLRRPAENSVLEARGFARFEIDKEPGAWADKLVAALPFDQIVTVDLRSQKGRTVFRKKKNAWIVEGRVQLSSAAISARITPVLTALSRLEADSVAADSAVHPFIHNGLKNPDLRIAVWRAGSEEPALELTVGPVAPEFTQPARKKGLDGYLYQFASWRLDPFREALKPMGPDLN